MTVTTLPWRPISEAPRGEWLCLTIEGMSRGYFWIGGNIEGHWVTKFEGKIVDSVMGDPTHFIQLEEPPCKIQ